MNRSERLERTSNPKRNSQSLQGEKTSSRKARSETPCFCPGKTLQAGINAQTSIRLRPARLAVYSASSA